MGPAAYPAHPCPFPSLITPPPPDYLNRDIQDEVRLPILHILSIHVPSSPCSKQRPFASPSLLALALPRRPPQNETLAA